MVQKNPHPYMKKGREFTRVATLVDAQNASAYTQLTPAKRLHLLHSASNK